MEIVKLIGSDVLPDDQKLILESARVIRLGFPQLTEERRRDLTKQVHKYGEEGKVALRNIRREAMDEIKKQVKKSEITEDDQKQL